MKVGIRSYLRDSRGTRSAYARARRWRDAVNGRRIFSNWDTYLKALDEKREGTVVLHTNDGLDIAIRRNLWDARIIREIFVDRPYVRHVALPAKPTIVDIGGYIGDFAIYAAKYLDPRRVIVYEPTLENFELLVRNIESNSFSDRITAVNKAVSDADEVVLNVSEQEAGEFHVSAYWYPQAERRTIPSVTLAGVFDAHEIDEIDLLKIDCEGGEYDIIGSAPDDVLKRVRNIVFEYHRIDGYEEKLDRLLGRLRSLDYRLRQDHAIVTAART